MGPTSFLSRGTPRLATRVDLDVLEWVESLGRKVSDIILNALYVVTVMLSAIWLGGLPNSLFLHWVAATQG